MKLFWCTCQYRFTGYSILSLVTYGRPLIAESCFTANISFEQSGITEVEGYTYLTTPASHSDTLDPFSPIHILKQLQVPCK